jgi:hypothetical protein
VLQAMVDGANSKASRLAPCLAATPTSDQLSEARLILMGAVQRWTDAGSGALQSETAGAFSRTIDTRQRTGYNLWPSEIRQLQDICRPTTEGSAQAYEVDTMPPGAMGGLVV